MLDKLNQEQKDSLLKTLILFAVNSNKEVQLSERFVKYAGQSFDLTINGDLTEDHEDGDRIYTFYLNKEYKKGE